MISCFTPSNSKMVLSLTINGFEGYNMTDVFQSLSTFDRLLDSSLLIYCSKLRNGRGITIEI